VPPSLEDDLLVERLRRGDEAAFTQIVDAWSGGLRRLAMSYVGTMASADEVVQDAWLAVIENLAGFEGRSSLKHWVFRIAANTAKRRASRDSRVVPVDLTSEDHPAVEPGRFQRPTEWFPGHWKELPAPWPTPEEATDAAEMRRVVADALRSLPPRQAAAVTLRDVEGYDAEETAELMGISTANQRVLLHRGRAGVRAAIEEYLSSGVTDRPAHDSGTS
jgi:RNA polymerase sigma-70 factor (ECF subfamily)